MAYHRHLPLVNDRPGILFMASAFCVTAISATALRFYSRRLTKLPLCADDWLALIAMIFVLGLNGIFIGGTAQGAITGHSPVVNDWPVSTDLEHLAEKYKYAFQTIEKITFGLIKISLLLLWKRIFSRAGRSFHVFCWAMIVIVTMWSISFFFATVFQCGTNWKLNWAPIDTFLTQCSNTLDMLTVFTATDLATDFIIIFMCVPIIWKLHMPTRTKAGVTSIFMVGILTVGAGIARMYVYLVTSYDKEDNPDFIGDFTLFILWSEIEVNIAMIVCSMPTFRPIVGRFRDTIVRLLHTMGINKWIRIPHSRSDSRGPEKNIDAGSHSTMSDVPFKQHHSWLFHERTWQGPANTVTTVGHAPYDDDLEARLNDGGILARTDISQDIRTIRMETLKADIR